MTTAPSDSKSAALARIHRAKAKRRKREIALLVLAGALALAALICNEPALILISIFPALASYGQR
jgi:hypothetical protein